MLDRCVAVFALNSKQLDRFRDSFSPAEANDDLRYALVPDTPSPEIIDLRELSWSESNLGAERTRLINDLKVQFRRDPACFLESGFRARLVGEPLEQLRMRNAFAERLSRRFHGMRHQFSDLEQCSIPSA